MLNVTYTDYKNVYGGSLSESDFTRLLPIVNIMIDDNTFNRYSKLNDKIFYDRALYCTGECIDKLYEFRTNTDSGGNFEGIKQSEKVGPWSVSYLKESLPKSFSSSIQGVVEKYFGSTYLCCKLI